ncbi:hypothetical protein CCMSSC00406_0010065 [Pleurotus cornucopiae]|uniref:Uncharacterized protein n=1 Tax=Pleurotus cornucopiae TaxID=5321 RepID=A0ACB7INV3_PLECO|nr:hypothetical protein CCMSSC00406_0010065 [Pleurotus cornucopiae]
MWASADQARLRYLKKNQNEIRASLYSGLEDAFRGEGDADLSQLGKRYILPSSYIGGPRHMQQRFQDAMAIARRFRKVDIFMTVTANPHWEEIEHELLPGQTSYDRPDLVARVFQLKKKAILEEIQTHGIFGRTVAYVYTIEFQKRGLPHMHILIFLADEDKLLTPEDIDSCISAEWPDPVTQPKLFETVKRCMVHGPCGNLNPNAPCMENGRCTKFYPKAFQPFTRMDEDGFPLYRSRNDGRVFMVGHSRMFEVDNRWIVPYCPYLSAKFDCHINVECAVMLRSVKYPFKYIHKGGDRATVELDNDEIKTYIEGRYIAASEAVWRLLHFSIHDQKPNVV